MTMSDDMMMEVLLSDSECVRIPEWEPLPTESDDTEFVHIDTKTQSAGDIVSLLRRIEKPEPRYALVTSESEGLACAIKAAELIRVLCPRTRVSVSRAFCIARELFQ